MDTIWIVALVLFCFMTGHSRTAALIMFWTTGLMALAFGLGGGFAVWSDMQSMGWVVASSVALFAGVFIFVAGWLLMVFVNGIVFGAVDSVLRAIRG